MKRLGDNSQKGAVLVFVALILPILVFFGGMAIDFGRAYIYKSSLQNAADAAALAGVAAAAESDKARLVEDIPSGFLTAIDSGRLSMAKDAANIVLRKDTGEERASDSNTKLRMAKEGEGAGTEADTYYYMVELTDEVKMVFAQLFLPEGLLPDGWKIKVSAKAWAKARIYDDGGDPYGRTLLEQMQEAENQTSPEYFSWEKSVGGNRQIAQQLSFTNKGVLYGEDGSRSEVLDMNVNTDRKDLFINFKQDVWYPSLLESNWDITDLQGLSYDDAKSRFDALKMKFTSVYFADEDTSRNNMTWKEFVNAYKTKYGTDIDYDKLLALLTSTIKDTIEINFQYPVRDVNDLPLKEISLTVTGKRNTQDPLFVRIESEEFNKNNVANSVRDISIINKVDNTSSSYRPLIFFYDGPMDMEGKRGVGRKSHTVVFELREDFKGMLFAPNSPVQVKGNGHKFQGFIIAQSILGPDGKVLDMPYSQMEDTDGSLQKFYTKLGFGEGTGYDDFDVVGLNVYKNPGKDIVFLTARADITR